MQPHFLSEISKGETIQIYIYPTKRGYKRWANAGHDRHTIMSKLDSTKALYEVMESENKYTKRITLESVSYQGDI